MFFKDLLNLISAHVIGLIPQSHLLCTLNPAMQFFSQFPKYAKCGCVLIFCWQFFAGYSSPSWLPTYPLVDSILLRCQSRVFPLFVSEGPPASSFPSGCSRILGKGLRIRESHAHTAGLLFTSYVKYLSS